MIGNVLRIVEIIPNNGCFILLNRFYEYEQNFLFYFKIIHEVSFEIIEIYL